VGQRSNGNEIHAGFGVCAHVFEIDAARTLEWDPAVGCASSLNRSPHISDLHVVQQDSFGAERQRVFEFGKTSHFNFDRLRSAAIAVRTLQRILDPPRERDVVVLDEHAVREIETMILPTATSDRILIKHAQARCSFAGVENSGFGSGDSLHELASQRGDPAEALQEIQDHALTGQNDACIVANDRDGLTSVQAHPIENFGMAGDFVMRNYGAIQRAIHVENAPDRSKTSQNAVLLGKNCSRRALAGINAGVAGRIARGPVLEQRVLNNGGDTTAVKVHNAVVRWSYVVR